MIGQCTAFRALACLAADLEIDDVVEYLAPDGVASCEPGRRTSAYWPGRVRREAGNE